MINRVINELIEKRLNRGKAIVLLGPRQVGKTTLINEFLKQREFLFLNGDDADHRELLENAGTTKLKSVIGDHKFIFIDEAQRIKGVGIIAKLIIDHFKDVQLFISRSSALEINDRMQESLTGRKFEYFLFPISWEELERQVGYLESNAQLEERLIYGMYPDVINQRHDAREVLKQLTSSYLYKDILSITGIKKPDLLDKLLKALALQLGSEVSYNELSRLLEVDKLTISKYIDLLEKLFIIFRLNSFSRNQRNEIKHNRKIYFYDNGIRNTIINNLNPIELRSDKGALWENFLISERIKLQQYLKLYSNNYFWRTIQKQEIDFIEERDGQIYAFEFKWNKRPKDKIPSSFIREYNAIGHIVDKQNFREFILPKEQDN